MTREGEDGFTLVELLVALLIFGMLSAASVALLTFSVRAQEVSSARLDEIAELRRAGALLTADLALAVPRLTRDEAGAVRPSFVGEAGGAGETAALALVRGGVSNGDGSPRPGLQKVEYRRNGDRLERRSYRFLDGAAPEEPVTILSGVQRLRLRYRDKQGGWRDRWNPAKPTELPVAVEISVDLVKMGSLRQLFITGTGS